MFAVIKSGGKQYKVAPNDVITVERLPGEVGETIGFDQVLMLGDGATTTIGTPLVAGACVSGEVLSQDLDGKIIVFKKHRRKDYRRRAGHRQALTVVRITEISSDGKPAAKKARAEPRPEPQAAAEAPAATETAAAAKPAAKKPAAKKPAAKKSSAKPAAKKAAAKKAPAKKAPAKKAAKPKAGAADGAKESD